MERLHSFRRYSKKWMKKLKWDKKTEAGEVAADFCFQTDFREETFSVSWCIKNLHRCSLGPGQYLESPTFTTGFSSEVKWNLRIYPYGRQAERYVGLFIHQITTESIMSLRYRMPVKLTLLPCSGEAQQMTIDADEVIALDGTEETDLFQLNFPPPGLSLAREMENPREYETEETDLFQLNFLPPGLSLAREIENPREYGSDALMSSEYLDQVKSFLVTCYITVTYTENGGVSKNTLERSKSLALSGDLKELLDTGRFSDVTLQAGQRQIPAHRAILASRSKVFDDQLRENRNETIELEGVDPSVVDDFLQYVYTGRVDEFGEETAARLLPVADRYRLEELKRECVETLLANLDVRNICRIAVLADCHSEMMLKQAVNYLFRQRKRDILLSEEWKKLVQENPRLASDILQAMSLDFYSEL